MATADLFTKIVDITDAETDNDHIHILIDNNSFIPDRTGAILRGDDAPLREIVKSAKRLEAQGADMLIMPCNTGHFYYDEISAQCKVPLINMVRETALNIKGRGYNKAALLSTDGALKSGVFPKYFEGSGIELFYPDEDTQRLIMHIIYDEVKAGKKPDISVLFPWLENMKRQGVQIFILGCTELPIAFEGCRDFSFADTTEILAESAVISMGYKLKRTHTT